MNLTKIDLILKRESYLSLDEVKKKLDTDTSGFYWIYTKKKIIDFKKSKKPEDSKHINLKELSTLHDNLPYVISQKDENYWCIYNGKGKKLKERITQAFNGPKKTGCLALSKYFNNDDFRIKYIECSKKNSKRGIELEYQDLEEHLERIWRLTNGWPIFCRQ